MVMGVRRWTEIAQAELGIPGTSLSSGEHDFVTHILAAEKRAYAGQEVRVCPIPADQDYLLQFGPSRFQRHCAGKVAAIDAKIPNRVGFINEGADGLEYQFLGHLPREFCGQFAEELVLEAVDSIGALIKEADQPLSEYCLTVDPAAASPSLMDFCSRTQRIELNLGQFCRGDRGVQPQHVPFE
jgi:hypothetical protein